MILLYSACLMLHCALSAPGAAPDAPNRASSSALS